MTLTLEHSVLWLKQLPLIRILALPNCDFQDTVQMSPYSVKSFLTKSPTYTWLVTSLFGPPLHFMQTSTPCHLLVLMSVSHDYSVSLRGEARAYQSYSSLCSRLLDQCLTYNTHSVTIIVNEYILQINILKVKSLSVFINS